MSKSHNKKSRQGFSLIELVIVVVIIAIIGAIAVPRMSRGAQGAADSALHANIKVLKSAIDLYATEHNGTYPFPVTAFTDQLTMFTDDAGATSPTKTGNFIYGPYLRTVPSLPVGTKKGSAVVVDGSSGTPGTAAGGWFYNPTTGDIKANLADAELDGAGKKYNAY
jgi:general secretion pathway protein G